MLITFKKKADFSVLTIRRDDQTENWEKVTEVGVYHDLVHFAVEKQLGFHQGFYGLINEGHAIPDFEKPRAERPTELIPANLPTQSIQTEFIVGLIQTALLDGSTATTVLEMIQEVLAEKEIPFPEQLTLPILTDILTISRQLITDWKALGEKEILTLSLDFDTLT